MKTLMYTNVPKLNLSRRGYWKIYFSRIWRIVYSVCTRLNIWFFSKLWLDTDDWFSRVVSTLVVTVHVGEVGPVARQLSGRAEQHRVLVVAGALRQRALHVTLHGLLPRFALHLQLLRQRFCSRNKLCYQLF